MARSDPWPVGFRVLAGSYVPASAANSEARPLQISVWYPASAGKGKRMTYRDYVALNASESDPEKPAGKAEGDAAVEEFRSFLVSAKVLASDATRVLSTPMKAIANAPAAKGRFPLVLISQGNGQSAHDQAFLAEALAAHGYVAATVPSAMRISGPMKGEEEIAAKATEQAEDLSSAAGRVKTRAELSEEGFAVVGHSFGARAALLLAMSDRSVRALVSLDGGIGAKTGRGMLERSRLFDAKAMAAPLLPLRARSFHGPGFQLIDSLDGSASAASKVPDMPVHFKRGVSLQRAPSLAGRLGATPGTPTTASKLSGAPRSPFDSVLKPRPGNRRPGSRRTRLFSLIETARRPDRNLDPDRAGASRGRRRRQRKRFLRSSSFTKRRQPRAVVGAARASSLHGSPRRRARLARDGRIRHRLRRRLLDRRLRVGRRRGRRRAEARPVRPGGPQLRRRRRRGVRRQAPGSPRGARLRRRFRRPAGNAAGPGRKSSARPPAFHLRGVHPALVRRDPRERDRSDQNRHETLRATRASFRRGDGGLYTFDQAALATQFAPAHRVLPAGNAQAIDRASRIWRSDGSRTRATG